MIERTNVMQKMITLNIRQEASHNFIAYLLHSVSQPIARNFGRSLRIPDASLQTSVNFPRTRPLKCMEQTAFLFNLNQERTEMKNSFKITVKHIISYAK